MRRNKGDKNVRMLLSMIKFRATKNFGRHNFINQLKAWVWTLFYFLFLRLFLYLWCARVRPYFFSRWTKYPRFKFTIHVCTCPERGDDDQSRLSTNDRNAEEQWRQLMSGLRARFFFKESEVEFFKKEKMNALKSKFPPQHRRPPRKKIIQIQL